MKALAAKIMNTAPIRFLVAVIRQFGRDNGGIYAGALSFFMLLAFVPLLLIGIAILARFVSPDQAIASAQALVQSFLPAGGASDEATQLLNNRLHLDLAVNGLVAKRGIAGILGFVSLVWAALQIFINAAAAMNNAWEVKESRNWLVLRLDALKLMAATGLLLVLTLLLSGAPDAIVKFDLPVVHHLPIPFWLLSGVFEIVAVIVNAALFLLIYKYLPNVAVPWKSAFIGGLSASVCWEVVKKGLAAWLLRPNHTIYGGLADLILFVLWIYYSMMILLLGAEVSAVYSRQTKPPEQEPA
jgi:membrane protein